MSRLETVYRATVRAPMAMPNGSKAKLAENLRKLALNRRGSISPLMAILNALSHCCKRRQMPRRMRPPAEKPMATSQHYSA